jgi:glycerol-3-phosphate acyltransferase PlsY
MWLAHALFIIACYFLGAIPMLVLIARWRGVRIEEGEDLHIAVWTRVGRNYGLAGVAFDVVGKGVLPVVAGFFCGLPMSVVLTGAVISVCGQMWPAFRKFDGEKGNTVSLGLTLTSTIIYQQWWIFLIAIPVGLGIGFKLLPKMFSSGKPAGERFRLHNPGSRSLPLGVIVGFIGMAVIGWLAYPPVLGSAYTALFILITIRRLTAPGLSDDLKTGGNLGNCLWNRFLYDRSFV